MKLIDHDMLTLHVLHLMNGMHDVDFAHHDVHDVPRTNTMMCPPNTMVCQFQHGVVLNF